MQIATMSPELAGAIARAWRRWGWLTAGFAILVAISGTQLYLQALHQGQAVSYLELFAANLLASLPWIPLGMAIVWWMDRYGFAGRRAMVLHAAATLATSTLFLTWLAFFHWRISATEAPSWSLDGYLFWLRSDFAEFFTWTVLLHWLIVAAALATRSPQLGAPEGTAQEEIPGVEAADAKAVAASDRPPPPLVIRSLGRTRIVDPATIEWIEAEGSYARLHIGDHSHLLRRSLKELEQALGPSGFARIHRSTLVRLDRIVEVRPRSHGDATAVLHGGQELRVSRTYRGSLAARGF